MRLNIYAIRGEAGHRYGISIASESQADYGTLPCCALKEPQRRKPSLRSFRMHSFMEA